MRRTALSAMGFAGRIPRQLKVEEDQRLAMCRKALAAADRDAEKRLVMEVAGRYPSVESLAIVEPYLEDPGVKASAAAATVAIAQKIGVANLAAVLPALEKAIEESKQAHQHLHESAIAISKALAKGADGKAEAEKTFAGKTLVALEEIGKCFQAAIAAEQTLGQQQAAARPCITCSALSPSVTRGRVACST